MSRGHNRPVTFVFEAQGGASSGLNKSTINAHIARQAHQRRREKQAALRAEGRGSSSSFSSSDSDNNRKRQVEQHQQPQQQKGSPTTEDYDSGYESGIPSPVKLAGNSDPFSTKAIAVTPEVNRLLVFTRDFILPAAHATEASVAGGRLHMARFWRDSVRGLDNGGGVAGYAYLARSAAILSTLTPRDRSSVVALQYLGKATSNLRKSIVMHSSSSNPDASQADAWDVYALFCAEIAAANLSAAAVHGAMLRRLLQPVGRTVHAERRLLMVVLQQDITRACLSLTRPSFDLHRWAEEYLPARITDDLNDDDNNDEDGRGGDHNYPSAFPFSPGDLSPSLSPALRTIFLGVREWLDALGIVMLNRDLFNLALLTNGAMKIMVLEGHLLNLYLDNHSIMEDDDSLRRQSPAAGALALAEAAMALAALYWVRRAAHERMDAGSKLEEAGSWAFDMSRAVATTLRDLDLRILQLEASSSSSSPEAHYQVRRSPQDRLWCLYVGTMAECNVRAQQRHSQSQSQSLTPPFPTEQQHSAGADEYYDEYSYHGTQLVQLTTTGAWSEIEPVLQRYLYIDMISLKAKRWFANNQFTPGPHGLFS
ncbi:hypothetical protein AYL99_02489 [Fonsecaea erecta]|uniref:Transcription factor domain-containing protein n=1 Tax=Fonsecaea erecta TaxID=1367422 RepID=A0A178ZU49_9EURO|nr:hypothetical protein AYL99_02489 [Fonsecaea erecta]OAP63262.1 hypothetical protein AYL99_02489 [Fonsecaea erecta]